MAFFRKSIAAFLLALTISVFVAPFVASAHEVYVLTPAQITQAIGTAPFDMVAVAENNLGQFVFWGFITALVIFCVFFISIFRFLERWLDPIFRRLRPYAPLVSRVTFGLSFLAGAYYQATYGPEMPIAATFGHWSNLVTLVLVTIGVLTIFGLYIRLAAAAALVMFSIAVYFHGWYMVTYVNYLGEILVLLILGAHNWSLDNFFAKRKGIMASGGGFIKRIQLWLAPKSFAILRVCFGTSLIFASAYAKVVYNNLGLMTVVKYHLDHILGFEPHFLVLGAAIIEILIGTFIILGIEIRFAALFFEFWLVLSLCFFGEVVWPHIILIGIPIALFMYGYDNYSVEGFIFRKKEYEPVL